MAADTLYAVIDTARDERLYPLVMQASDRACLFGGEVAEPLNRAAPYLVDLKPQEPLFRAWRDEGYGQSWGIMLRSQLPLGALRLHLKHFLVARLPDGMVAQFRFYDPRVFGPYLSSCTADELASWFGGVSVFLVERLEGGGFHEFSFDGARLNDGAAALQ
jgi:hypothetical protein